MYSRWYNMIYRCENPKSHKFHNYGARGIEVCDKWRNSIEAYIDYVMDLPNAKEEGYTLDRINVNGNYEPGNMRWASAHTQVANSKNGKQKSGYKGVYPRPINKFEAGITLHRKKIYLGYHGSPRDAAIARDQYIIDNELWEYPLQVLTNHSNNVT